MNDNVALALRMEISSLITKTGSLKGPILEMKAHVVDTERIFKKAGMTIEISDSSKKTSTEKVSSLKKELSTVSVERANLRAGLINMASIS